MLITPRGESRYFVLVLFTISMIAGSMLYGGVGALVPYVGRVFDLPHAQLGLIATASVLGGAAGYAMAWQLTAAIGILAAVPALLATKVMRQKVAA